MSENITVQGTCTGVREKSVWVLCPDGEKRSFARSKITVLSGSLERDQAVTLSLQQWAYEGAHVYGKREPAKAGSKPITSPTGSTPAIPQGMLERLILLCDPTRHDDDREAMIAFGWLISVKEGC